MIIGINRKIICMNLEIRFINHRTNKLTKIEAKNKTKQKRKERMLFSFYFPCKKTKLLQKNGAQNPQYTFTQTHTQY